MSLRPRRIGETQAQYRRRVGTSRQQTVGRPQRVERVSVMPQQIAEPMTAEEKRKRKPQQTGVGVAIPEKKTDRANQQNLLEAQRRNAVADKRVIQAAPDTRTKQERDAELQRFLKNAPPEIRAKVKAQLKEQADFIKRQQQKLKQRQKQQAEFRIIEKLVNPRTGKPFTPQQLKQIRANNERFAKEQATKQPLLKKFMEGSIGVRELRGTFTPREIRNIEKGRIAQQFMQGKITDRQLSRSGKFSLKEIRDIKKSLQFKRMSPEERRAFIEREQQRQLRQQRRRNSIIGRTDRRRRQVRRAYRRGRGDDRDNVITYQTTGRRRRVSPMQTQRRRRVAPTQRRRRGMRVPI